VRIVDSFDQLVLMNPVGPGAGVSRWHALLEPVAISEALVDADSGLPDLLQRCDHRFDRPAVCASDDYPHLFVAGKLLRDPVTQLRRKDGNVSSPDDLELRTTEESFGFCLPVGEAVAVVA